MSLYYEYDIELLKKKSEHIKQELEKIRSDMDELSVEQKRKIQMIILNYCREKKRKIYGGYAWNLLIINKNKEDKIYSDNKIADIDIYSPEPIQDLYNICNALYKEGFKYILGEEAIHKETYGIKVFREKYCDLSYVPKNIYNRIPYIEINGVYCTHPNFMTIDYLRQVSDPVVSYWRFFESGEELKTFKRFFKLQKNYPLPFNNKPLNIQKPDVKITNALSYIYRYLLNKTTTITVGFYAYNYFCHMSGYDHIQMPFYEFISVDYKNDALELIELLKKEFNDNITYEEFYPFFQYTDYSVEIYLNGNIICRIYNNNNKCTPYQELSAYNFDMPNLVKTKDHIRIGTFTVVLLYFLVDALKMRVKKDNEMEKFYYHVISHCIQSKQNYLGKYKKSFLDDTIFKEFTISCMGQTLQPEVERMILIEKRKKQKKPLVFRYEPGEEQKEAPKYIFTNSSGNKINKEKNLRLKEHIENEDDDEEEQEEIETKENI